MRGSTEGFSGRVRAALAKCGRGLSAALYPAAVTCDVCGAELTAETRYTLCAECMTKLPRITGHRCLVCGVPINDEADYCLRCQRTESVFRRNVSPLRYDGEGRQLVHMLKFGGKRYIARLLGAMMADEFLSSGEECEIVVPVPMSEKEVKRRGFNQSELLAADIGERLGMPVLPALAKVKDTPPQKELTGQGEGGEPQRVFRAAVRRIREGEEDPACRRRIHDGFHRQRMRADAAQRQGAQRDGADRRRDRARKQGRGLRARGVRTARKFIAILREWLYYLI